MQTFKEHLKFSSKETQILWNYLQAKNIYLHSSISKYISSKNIVILDPWHRHLRNIFGTFLLGLKLLGFENIALYIQD